MTIGCGYCRYLESKFKISGDFFPAFVLGMKRKFMETIARFDSPEDAYLFRSFLASHGIGSTVLDEHVAQLFWHYRYAAGGVRVVLDHEEDLDDALAVGGEYFSALNAKPVMMTEVRGWGLVLLLSWFFGGPLPIFGRREVGEVSAD